VNKLGETTRDALGLLLYMPVLTIKPNEITIKTQSKYTVNPKNWATFIFSVTLANVGRFLKFFQCWNQKEMAHNKNEKFPTVA